MIQSTYHHMIPITQHSGKGKIIEMVKRRVISRDLRGRWEGWMDETGFLGW